MQKYVRTGLLIITLAFPVLFFIFLKLFANNHFDLPYFIPLRDVNNQVVTKADGDTAFYQIQRSSLPTLGSVIDAKSLKGKTVLVNTIASPCGDTCQQVLNQLVRLQTLQQEYPSFTILTLIDKNDAQIIPLLGERRQSDAGWLVSALPDSTLRAAIQNVFRLSENVPGMQTISPSARLSLLDSAGFIRGFYDTTDPEEIDRIMAEIKILEYNRMNGPHKQ